nr:MAG TPA: hypothetical protein [Caudoviricetes sp.]
MQQIEHLINFLALMLMILVQLEHQIKLVLKQWLHL